MKNNKKVKKTIVSAAVGCMLATYTIPAVIVNAQKTNLINEIRTSHTTVDGEVSLGMGAASITIKGKEGQTLVGKQFAVYKLLDAENSANGESIKYTLNANYETELKTLVGSKLSKPSSEITEEMVVDYISNLGEAELRTFIEEIRTAIKGKNNELIDVKNTKLDNSIKITGLEVGYYIVDEVTTLTGTSTGSLCIVNTADENIEVNIKSENGPTIQKQIQDDDGSWGDMGDFEIGQTVPFKYTSIVPNISAFKNYYLAFHDTMDNALTFKQESLKVVISDGLKDYTLTAMDFEIKTSGIGSETFNVIINDLKDIVDREFPGGTYGQEITLTYDATLNDTAAMQTGTPGIKNSVTLEFSNDPDSDSNTTGSTLPDEVVAYTYKMDLTKTNDEESAKFLSGAKFRIYSDADLKNEVYVKQTSEGNYTVINRDSVTGDTAPVDAVEMVTPENGKLAVNGLDSGIYYLKETQAPDGYRPIKDAIVINVTPTYGSKNDYNGSNGLTNIDATATIGNNPAQDLATNLVEGSFNLTVVNNVASKLPITGSNATIILIASGSALMITALLLSRKKRNEDNIE